jgi:hypothetical protein
MVLGKMFQALPQQDPTVTILGVFHTILSLSALEVSFGKPHMVEIAECWSARAEPTLLDRALPPSAYQSATERRASCPENTVGGTALA